MQKTLRSGGRSQVQAMMAGQSRLLPMWTFTTHRNSFDPDTPTSASYRAETAAMEHTAKTTADGQQRERKNSPYHPLTAVCIRYSKRV